MKLSIAFLLLWIGFSACNTNKSGVKTVSSELQPVSLERTACFGKCPQYQLSIEASGKATLKVVKNVKGKESGTYNCNNCDTRLLKVVLDKATEIHYNDLDSLYDPGVSDLPSVITTIGDKKVVNLMGAPKGLDDLEQLIDSLYLKGANWKK